MLSLLCACVTGLGLTLNPSFLLIVRGRCVYRCVVREYSSFLDIWLALKRAGVCAGFLWSAIY